MEPNTFEPLVFFYEDTSPPVLTDVRVGEIHLWRDKNTMLMYTYKDGVWVIMSLQKGSCCGKHY